MDSEFQELEAALKNLRPESFSAAYLDRLTTAIEGRAQTTAPGLQQVERALAGLMPVALSTGLSDKCLETVTRVPFPVDEKVVLFPGKSQRQEQKAPARRSWWTGAAAAAVAVAGAFSATFVGGGGHPAINTVASNSPTLSISPNASANTDSVLYSSPAAPGSFVPASTHTGVQDAQDEGVVWNQQGAPIRMVKVTYMETVKLKDKDGKMVEVRRPREGYIAVPEKVD